MANSHIDRSIPPFVKELGLSQYQCFAVRTYIQQRIKWARHQRNCILMAFMVVVGTVFMNIVRPEITESSAFTTLSDNLISWMVPIALALSVLVLIIGEVAALLLYKGISNSAFAIPSDALAEIRKMGNSVALYVLLGRPMPT